MDVYEQPFPSGFPVIRTNRVKMSMDAFEQTTYWLLSGSKGAINRIKILQLLRETPCNLHELSKKAGLNYKTAQHHITLLLEHHLIVGRGSKYGQVYFVSDKFLEKESLFNKLVQASLLEGNPNEKE